MIDVPVASSPVQAAIPAQIVSSPAAVATDRIEVDKPVEATVKDAVVANEESRSGLSGVKRFFAYILWNILC